MSCDMTSAEMDELGRMSAVDLDRFLREQRAKLQALERQKVTRSTGPSSSRHHRRSSRATVTSAAGKRSCGA